MIAELGHFSLILALCMALVLGTLPIIGAFRAQSGWIAVARPAAFAQLLFMALSYSCLTYSCLTHDFTVKYIATNSNTSLPTLYLISGVWGAHEGSLLLWGLVLTIWTALVAQFSKSIPDATLARVLGVMGLVSIGFILFLLLTSNPFERLFPAPLEGRDLNPYCKIQGWRYIRPCYIWVMSVFPSPLRSPLPPCLKVGWMPPGRVGPDRGLIWPGCF